MRMWKKKTAETRWSDQELQASVLHSYTLTLPVNGDFKIADGDGNENVKKAIGLITEMTTLLVQHTFFVHFFAVFQRLRRETVKFHV